MTIILIVTTTFESLRAHSGGSLFVLFVFPISIILSRAETQTSTMRPTGETASGWHRFFFGEGGGAGCCAEERTRGVP